MRLAPWRKSDPTRLAASPPHRIEGLFGRIWDGAPSPQPGPGSLPTDIAEREREFTATLESPGCGIDDIEVAMAERQRSPAVAPASQRTEPGSTAESWLTTAPAGDVLPEQVLGHLDRGEQHEHHRVEGRHGAQARSLTLPAGLDMLETSPKAKARVKGG